MADTAEVSVVVELQAQIEKFVRAISVDAPNALNDGMRKIVGIAGGSQVGAAFESAGTEMGSRFVKGFGLIASAAATMFLIEIKKKIDEAAAYASGLSTLKLNTGDSTADLQKLQYAFESVGVSAEQSQAQFSQFQYRIEQAASLHNGKSIFERMGLDPRQMQTATLTQNIEAVSEKIRELKNASDKSAASRDIFGRSGPQLLPILDQGRAGIQQAMAQGQGAVIPQETLDKLEELHEKLAELKQDTLAFFASFIEPMVNGFLRIISIVQSVQDGFTKLDDAIKQNVIFGALIVALKFAEDGLSKMHGLLVNLVGREVLAGLADLIGGLGFIVDAVTVLYTIWKTNFGGIQQIAQQVFDAIGTFFQQLQQTIQALGDEVKERLLPAWGAFGSAMHGVFQAVADMIDGLLRSGVVTTLLYDAVSAVIVVLQVLFDTLAKLKPVIWLVVDAFEAWMAIRIGMWLGDLIASLVVLTTTTLPAFIASLWAAIVAIGTDLVAACGAAVTALYTMAVAEDVATDGLTLIPQIITAIAIAVAALTAAIVLNFGKIEIWVLRVLAAVEKWAKAIGLILLFIPGFEALGAALLLVGDSAEKASQKTSDLADQLQRVQDLKDAVAGDHDAQNRLGAGFGDADAARWDARAKNDLAYQKAHDKPHEHKGTSLLGPVGGSKSKDTATKLAIDAIKNALDLLKDAVAGADDKLRELKSDYSNIPEGPMKWLQQQQNLNEQLVITETLMKRQAALHAAVGAAMARMPAIIAAGKTPADKETARKELESLRREYSTTGVTLHEDQNSLASLRTQKANIGFQHNADIRDISQQEVVSSGDHRITGIEDARARRDARPISTTNPQLAALEAQARKVADAFDTVAIDVIKKNESDNAFNEAMRASADAIAQYGQGSIEARKAAIALAKADDDAAKAATDLKVAQIALKDAQMATSQTVLDVRNGFASLISTALGPFAATVKLIQEGANPLAAIFITLFEKSKSFNDILTILGEVARALAQVFDALRPVIDFFLGVLVGIVDVFLGLYNVIAQVLNMFGLHIQKIQLLNAALDTTTKTVPLLQVTHDLPTINEYNKGQWSDLVAKQDAANNTAQSTQGIIDAGFSNSIAKLGEIVGAILAVKAILMIIQAQGVIKDAFSAASSNGGGIWGFIKGLFGASSTKTPVTDSVTKAATSAAVQAGTVAGLDDTGITDGLKDAANATVENTEALRNVKAGLGTGTGTSGVTNALQTTAKVIGGLADVAGIVGGFQQGGIGGGIQAGLSADSLALLLGATGGLATPIAIGVGLLSAIFGGNHDNPANMPDKYDTARFTTEVGELQGSAATAYGPAYNPATDQVQQQLGAPMLQYIETWISQNLNSKDPAIAAEAQALLSQYGTTGGGKLSFGKDIGDEAVVGGTLSGKYTDIYAAASQAVQAIQALSQSAMTLGNVLNNATNVDLANLFGNSSVVTADGGYAIIPGADQGMPKGYGPDPGKSADPPMTHVEISIGQVVGADPNVLRDSFGQIVTDALNESYQQQQIALRTRQYTTGVQQ